MSESEQAQRRVHRILAFRDELAALEAEGRRPFDAAAVAEVTAYHDALIARLTERFDVDASDAAGRLSRSLRVAAFLGAVALTASAWAAVSRLWDRVDEVWQVLFLAALPVVALAAVEVSARRERTRYVAWLFAIAAFGCIWLAIIGVREVLNVGLPMPVLWLGTIASMALASAYGFRLVFGGAVAALVLAIGASLISATGADWRMGWMRLEPLLMAALAVLGMAHRLEQAGPGFGAVARGVSATLFLGVLLVLSTTAEASHLALTARAVEGLYQGLFLVAALAAIAIGLVRRWPELVTPSVTLFVLFVLIRLVDWFWDAVPAWLFFLMLAGFAFVCIVALRRARGRLAGMLP